MPKKIDVTKLAESLLDPIDDATGPKEMDKTTALAVLEEIESMIHGRMEAIKEELGDDE